MAHYEPGTYDVIIKDHGLDVSKEKKTPFVWLLFRPVKCNGTEIESPYEREVRLWLTDNTHERTIERLRALGWKGTSFGDLENGQVSFAGTNCQLQCTRTPDGQYEDWQFPAPAGALSEKRTGMARKLDALFGKALRGSASQTPAVSSEPEQDDDCPF